MDYGCGCGCGTPNDGEYTLAGGGVKFAVNMTCEGFDMDEDDWTITVSRGDNVLVFDKDSAVKDGDGQWYICVDTEALGAGEAGIVFEAYVPDEDFEGGLRHEIQEFRLMVIKNPKYKRA